MSINHSNSSIYSIIAAIVSGNKRRLKSVFLPCNRTAIGVVSVLLRDNQISGYRVHKLCGRNVVAVNLRYPDNLPKLSRLRFVSKPSRRVYTTIQRLRMIMLKEYSSTVIISCSYGIISGADAILLNSGGEIVCILN